MNTIELSSPLMRNVTFITRLRGNGKSQQNTKNIKTSTNLNDSKTNINKSKTFQQKNNKSAPKTLNNKIKDNIKYTMFTSGDSSNIMLVSKKPITGSTINEALKVCNNLYDFHNSILNETSLLEYDKIYNETNSIDKIYNDIIKDNIVQLFHKKNSCVFFFGPSQGGKSYLLMGEKDDVDINKNKYYSKIDYNKRHNNNKKPDQDTNKKIEGGLLRRSINNILNLININKQGNDKLSNIQNKYELIFSSYLIYMDKIYDLLSKETKSISLQKYYDDNQNININLVGLTDAEIRTISDYDKISRDIEYYKNNLSKNLKIKNLDKNSHIIISLKLQKKIQNTVGNNVTDNYTINSYSQIDFIELIPSEIGLNEIDQDEHDLSYEYKLYSNTKNDFNSLCENIVSVINGITPNKESLLTLSLKNTLKANSSIIFFNCVIPWEFPLAHSFKSLKFTTWLRNQVINEGVNINNNSIIMNNINNKNTRNDNNNNLYPKTNNSFFINNYQNPISLDNNNSYINNDKNEIFNINKTYPEINNCMGQSINNGNNNNILINEEQNLNNSFNMNEASNNKLMRSRSGRLNIKTNKSFDFNNLNKNQNLTQNEKTIQILEKTLKELEAKKIEIENKMIEERNKASYTNSINSNYKNNISQKNNIITPEDLRLKEEQDILKSDNIIMREDISRLSETNQNLENEISHNREVISQLQSENQKLNEENSILKSRLNDYDNQNYSQLYLNGQISKEDFLLNNYNERFLLQNKIKDLENNYDIIKMEKTKYEVDYKVLLSKYEEIKEKYDKMNFEYINNKQMHDNELYNIDNKINNLSKEIERLQIENSDLRKDNEKQRNILNLLNSERDMYKEKFEDKKYENDLLNKKIFEVEKVYNDIIKEKEYERYYKMQKEENYKNNKNRNEVKNKIAQELQSKIQQYRRERLQKKNNEDYFD